jgi:hypothetical protein
LRILTVFVKQVGVPWKSMAPQPYSTFANDIGLDIDRLIKTVHEYGLRKKLP